MKKILSLILALAISLGIAGGVGVTPLYATPSIDDLEESIQKADNEISVAMHKMDELTLAIDEKELALANAENELRALEAEAEEAREKYGKNIRMTYKRGGMEARLMDYVNAIFSGGSISDVLTRIDVVMKLYEHERSLVDEIENTKDAVDKKRDEIKKDNDSLKKDVQELENQIKETENKKTELLRTLQQQQSYLSRALTVQTPIEVSAEASEQGRQIINEAQRYLGVPYRWGGTTPSGFDCSGLVQYVYGKYGVSLPRVSQTQQRAGITIGKEYARPGDLVFFGTPAHHVGIYMGNGLYLHAPRTGDVVKIASLDWSRVSTVARVL